MYMCISIYLSLSISLSLYMYIYIYTHTYVRVEAAPVARPSSDYEDKIANRAYGDDDEKDHERVLLTLQQPLCFRNRPKMNVVPIPISGVFLRFKLIYEM